jgi:hypothetical protein
MVVARSEQEDVMVRGLVVGHVCVLLLGTIFLWAECPDLVGSIDTPDQAKDAAASGHYVYVADDESGLRIIDVSTPSAPTEVGSFDTPTRAIGIDVADVYVYVADGAGGLRVIDVSTPSAPVEVGFTQRTAFTSRWRATTRTLQATVASRWST